MQQLSDNVRRTVLLANMKDGNGVLRNYRSLPFGRIALSYMSGLVVICQLDMMRTSRISPNAVGGQLASDRPYRLWLKSSIGGSEISRGKDDWLMAIPDYGGRRGRR